MTSGAWAQDKKLVAVLDFDYGTVRSAVQAYFGTDQDVGKGISLLLEQKLVQDGKYRVIDRNAMDKILKEQNFSNSDRVDPYICRQNRPHPGRECHHHRQHHPVWPRR